MDKKNHHIKNFFKFLEHNNEREIPANIRIRLFFNELTEQQINEYVKSNMIQFKNFRKYPKDIKVVRLFDNNKKISDMEDPTASNIVDSNNKSILDIWPKHIYPYSDNLLVLEFENGTYNILNPFSKKMIFQDKDYVMEFKIIQREPERAIVGKMLGEHGIVYYNIIDENGNLLMKYWCGEIRKIPESSFLIIRHLFSDNYDVNLWHLLDLNRKKLYDQPFTYINGVGKNFIYVDIDEMVNFVMKETGKFFSKEWFTDKKISGNDIIVHNSSGWYAANQKNGTIIKIKK